jgi:hypothetical protein
MLDYRQQMGAPGLGWRSGFSDLGYLDSDAPFLIFPSGSAKYPGHLPALNNHPLIDMA